MPGLQRPMSPHESSAGVPQTREKLCPGFSEGSKTGFGNLYAICIDGPVEFSDQNVCVCAVLCMCMQSFVFPKRYFNCSSPQRQFQVQRQFSIMVVLVAS